MEGARSEERKRREPAPRRCKKVAELVLLRVHQHGAGFVRPGVLLFNRYDANAAKENLPGLGLSATFNPFLVARFRLLTL